jgi:hypothetical protein
MAINCNVHRKQRFPPHIYLDQCAAGGFLIMSSAAKFRHFHVFFTKLHHQLSSEGQNQRDRSRGNGPIIDVGLRIFQAINLMISL